jgi:hypothetical protein
MVDTNLVAEMVRQVIAESQKSVPSIWPTAVKDVITIITPCLVGLVVWYQKRQDAKLAAVTSATISNTVVSEKTAGTILEIEKSVNSERSKMIEEVKAITRAFTEVSNKLAVLEERRDVDERAKVAIAAAAAAIVHNKEQVAQAVEEFRKLEAKPKA